MSVYELESRCFKDPYPISVLVFYAATFPDLFLVAEEGNRIVGYVIGLIEQQGRVGHIISICVDPDMWGRGYGSMLMDSIEDIFRRRRACRSILEVRVSNTRAISFYEGRGYRIDGVIKGYYLDNEDAYIMSKRLC